jgi:hypothetical protein
MQRFLTVLVLLSLALSGCTVHRAQVAVQVALTAAAEGVDAADVVVDEALPAAFEQAGDDAITECAGACVDPMAIALRNLRPWTAAMTGVRHAVDTLTLLESGLHVWIATGALPDWSGVCAESEEVFGSLLALLQSAGLQPPELLSTVAPHIDTACTLVVGLVQAQQGGE